MFGFVDGLVGLDEDGCAFALHCDGGEVVEDVASFGEVPVPPDLQMGLASQPRGNLVANLHTQKQNGVGLSEWCYSREGLTYEPEGRN